MSTDSDGTEAIEIRSCGINRHGDFWPDVSQWGKRLFAGVGA